MVRNCVYDCGIVRCLARGCDGCDLLEVSLV